MAVSNAERAVSDAELTCMIFLDCIETGLGIPDGCDIDGLAAQGLIQCVDGGWSLTPRGQLRLRKLRSCARRSNAGEQRLH
jgi:hypothetical protein